MLFFIVMCVPWLSKAGLLGPLKTPSVLQLNLWIFETFYNFCQANTDAYDPHKYDSLSCSIDNNLSRFSFHKLLYKDGQCFTLYLYRSPPNCLPFHSPACSPQQMLAAIRLGMKSPYHILKPLTNTNFMIFPSGSSSNILF